MFAGVMLPLWPPTMRLGVWHVSIEVLGLICLSFAIAIVRLISYLITVVVTSPGIWMSIQLFADVGFVSISSFSILHSHFEWAVLYWLMCLRHDHVESFIPLWGWDLPKKKSRKERTEKVNKRK